MRSMDKDASDEEQLDRRTQPNEKKQDLLEYLKTHIDSVSRNSNVREFFKGKLLRRDGCGRLNRALLFLCALEVLHKINIVKIIHDCTDDYIDSIWPHNVFSCPKDDEKSQPEEMTNIGFARKIVVLDHRQFKEIMKYFLFYDEGPELNTTTRYTVFKKQCFSEVGWGLYVPTFYTLTRNAANWKQDMENNKEWVEGRGKTWQDYFDSLPWPLVAPLITNGTVMEYLGIPKKKDFSEPTKALWGNKSQKLGRFVWVDMWESGRMQSFFHTKTGGKPLYTLQDPRKTDSINDKADILCNVHEIEIPPQIRTSYKRKKLYENPRENMKKLQMSLREDSEQEQQQQQEITMGMPDGIDDSDEEEIPDDDDGRMKYEDYAPQTKPKPIIQGSVYFDEIMQSDEEKEESAVPDLERFKREVKAAVQEVEKEDLSQYLKKSDSKSRIKPIVQILGAEFLHLFREEIREQDKILFTAQMTDQAYHYLTNTWEKRLIPGEIQKVDRIFQVLFNPKRIPDITQGDLQIQFLKVILEALRTIGCFRQKEKRMYAISKLETLLEENAVCSNKSNLLFWTNNILKYSWKIRSKAISGTEKIIYYVDIVYSNERDEDLMQEILQTLQQNETTDPSSGPWNTTHWIQRQQKSRPTSLPSRRRPNMSRRDLKSAQDQQEGAKTFILPANIVENFSRGQLSHGYPEFLTNPAFYTKSILNIPRRKKPAPPAAMVLDASEPESESEPDDESTQRKATGSPRADNIEAIIKAEYFARPNIARFTTEEKKCLEDILVDQMRQEKDNLNVIRRLILEDPKKWTLTESEEKYRGTAVNFEIKSTALISPLVLTMTTLLWFLPLQSLGIAKLIHYYSANRELLQERIDRHKTYQTTTSLQSLEWLQQKIINQSEPTTLNPYFYITDIKSVRLGPDGKIDHVRVKMKATHSPGRGAKLMFTQFKDQDTAKSAAEEFISINSSNPKKKTVCEALRNAFP